MSFKSENKIAFLKGMRDGIPIGLGYFAVAFSLGIVAKKAGLTPLQGFIASFFNVASAGEYALFTSIETAVSYIEIALITFAIPINYVDSQCIPKQVLMNSHYTRYSQTKKLLKRKEYNENHLAQKLTW